MIWNQRIDINTVYSDYRNTRLSSRSWGSVRGSCVDIVHNARWSIMYAETNIWPQLTKTTIYTSISLYRRVVTYCIRLIYIYYQLLYSCIVVHIVCIYRHICFLISSQLFFFLNKRMHACMQGGEFSNKTVVERKTFVVIPLIFWPIFLRNKHHNSWCSVSSLFLLIKQTIDHHKDAIILSSFLFWPYVHFLYLLQLSLILLRIRFVLSIDDSYFSV